MINYLKLLFIIKQYSKLFSIDGVNLEFEKEALDAIAKRALERKTGARGLRAILENMLLDSMFNLTDYQGKKMIITKAVVDGESAPIIQEIIPTKVPRKKAG